MEVGNNESQKFELTETINNSVKQDETVNDSELNHIEQIDDDKEKIMLEFAEEAESYKVSLSEAQQKLTDDLLALTDENYPMPPSLTVEQLKENMKRRHQLVYAGEADVLGIKNGNVSSDLVYVYIYIDESSNTSIIDPYVSKVVSRQEKYHFATAWVQIDNLEKLASLQEVRSIDLVLPPVTNKL